MPDTETHTLTGYEAQAHRVFDQLVKDEWSQGRVLVASVFRPMWSASLPVAQIEAIASAMHCLQSCNLQPTLTELVRLGVLRSRVIRGVRHYEVAYTDEQAAPPAADEVTPARVEQPADTSLFLVTMRAPAGTADSVVYEQLLAAELPALWVEDVCETDDQ